MIIEPSEVGNVKVFDEVGGTPDHGLASHVFQSVTFWFRNFSVSRLLSIFGGFWFQKIWFLKKVSSWFRKNLVSKKLVSDKSLGFIFRKYGLGLMFLLEGSKIILDPQIVL